MIANRNSFKSMTNTRTNSQLFLLRANVQLERKSNWENMTINTERAEAATKGLLKAIHFSKCFLFEYLIETFLG